MGSLELITDAENPPPQFDLIAPPKSRPLSKPHRDHAIQFDIDGNMNPVPAITKAAKRLAKFKREYENSPTERNREKFKEQEKVMESLSNLELF